VTTAIRVSQQKQDIFYKFTRNNKWLKKKLEQRIKFMNLKRVKFWKLEFHLSDCKFIKKNIFKDFSNKWSIDVIPTSPVAVK